MTSTEGTAELPEYVEHQVDHYKQRFNWDCGVSCILMLLSREQRQEFLQNFTKVCQEEGFGQSTWTIDLCYLLKRYDIKHCLYTTMPGVNEDYQKQGYYEKIINLDRERVRRRFDDAPSLGIEVAEARLGARRLAYHVATHGPALVLLDGGLLSCDLCKHNRVRATFRQCFGGGYSGHYVLVVGYRRGAGGRGDKFVYRDPALSPRLCVAAVERLQRARAAAGTDHDVVLVYTSSSEDRSKDHAL